MTDPAFTNLLEKRYFQFFRQKTMASTTSLFDFRFWDRVVLQACHYEPAIKHAVLALSSWHQTTNPQANGTASLQHHNFATKQYHLALSHAQKLVSSARSEDIETILIACIVCICYETVQGEYQASQVHMDHGRAILRQHAHKLRNLSRQSNLREIQHVFARFEVSSSAFSSRASKLHSTVDDLHKNAPYLVPQEFKTMDETQASVNDLMQWTLLVMHYHFMAIQWGRPEDIVKLQAEKDICAKLIRARRPHIDSKIHKVELTTHAGCLILRH